MPSTTQEAGVLAGAGMSALCVHDPGAAVAVKVAKKAIAANCLVFILYAFHLMVADLSGGSSRRPASEAWNGDPRPPVLSSNYSGKSRKRLQTIDPKKGG